MKRIVLITISYLAAGAVAIVPAIIGLAGNPSFSHQLPVRAPDNARPVTVVAADNPRPVHHLRQADSADDRSRDRRGADDGPRRARGSREIERRDDRGGRHDDSRGDG